VVGGKSLTIGADYPFADTSHHEYVLGFDGALGMDYLLTKYVFVRGEVEYLSSASRATSG
jgi:hypothetical protein